MKIIIEVSGGCVCGVYYKRQTKSGRIPDVCVVNLDAIEVGEPIEAEKTCVEPLKNACEETIEALQ